MKINYQFPYRKLDRFTRPDGIRHYGCPDTNLLVPSITTIIGQTESKKELLEWRERVGDVKADQIKNQATGLGSLVHKHIENHVMGIERPTGTNVVRVLAKNMADQIIEHGIRYVDEVWGQEVGLNYPGLFAGTTDLVGIYKGKSAIMDHKTATKMRTKKQIESYRSQIAAYCLCHDLHFDTNIQVGIVFMVARDNEFKQFVVEGEELEYHKTDFLLRLEKYISIYGDSLPPSPGIVPDAKECELPRPSV